MKILVTVIFAMLVLSVWTTVQPPQRAATQTGEAVSPLWGSLKSGPYRVGFQVQYRMDSARAYGAEGSGATTGRPIRIMIWYPAEQARAAEPMRFADYVTLPSSEPRFAEFSQLLQARDTDSVNRQFSDPNPAPLVEKLKQTRVAAYLNAPPVKGRFPLVMHSLGRNSLQQENTVLWEYLASHGYVVASVPQLGAGPDKRLAFALPDLNLQRQDVEFALAALKTFPNADANRLAIMGHSGGGWIAVLMAMQNREVKAVVSLDGSALTKEGVEQFTAAKADPAQMRVPLLALYKTATVPAPPDFSLLDQFVFSDRYLFAFPKATHFDFQNWPLYSVLTNTEDRRGTPFRPASVGRDIYLAICRYTMQFLDGVLKNDAALLQRLRREAAQPEFVTTRFQPGEKKKD